MGNCPFIALCTVELEQRAKLMVSLIWKAKSVASSALNSLIKCTPWPDLGSQTGFGSHCVACQGRAANSQTQLLLNIVPSYVHLVSLTRESILLPSPSYILTWVGTKPAFLSNQLFSARCALPHPHPQSSNSCLTPK